MKVDTDETLSVLVKHIKAVKCINEDHLKFKFKAKLSLDKEYLHAISWSCMLAR